jgi:chromosome segregation ATPase
MTFSLFAKILGKHVEGAGNHLTEALINFDPETALEADRDQLREKLQEFSVRLAKARQEYAVDIRHRDELKATIDQQIKAATILDGKVQAGDKDSEASLTTLLDSIEDNKAKLQVGNQEVDEVHKLCEELEAAAKQVSDHLEHFERDAAQAKRELQLSALKKEGAEAQVERQAELNALKAGSADHLHSALGALQRKVQDNEAQAEAAQTMVDLGTAKVDKDDRIQAAMREATGATQESASARLARLRA